MYFNFKKFSVKKICVFILLILVVVNLGSCSIFNKNKKGKRNANAISSQESNSSSGISSKNSKKNGDSNDDSNLAMNLAGTDSITEEIKIGSSKNSKSIEEDPLFVVDESMENRSPAAAAGAEKSSTVTSKGKGGGIGEYTVGKGETLMWVAFKIYGNYNKWKSIAKLNVGKVKKGEILKEGIVLQYKKPQKEFTWEPNGEPYLVRPGDTLGKISKKVYDTIKRWKEIWNNNKLMIKNPNIIFAGFTLYYVPSEKGNIAKVDTNANVETDVASTVAQTDTPVESEVNSEIENEK
ncbi:MAG: LysM peptidoglycan-binding domain-containing protein [Oligoflexia bacterium]|nr:LysM peptidoglycan-binding domain-containing protein [Oligoflexia bacterium]